MKKAFKLFLFSFILISLLSEAKPSSSLKLVGKGIRKILVKKVYKLEFYVSNPDKFDKEKPLKSLKTQKEVLIKLVTLMTMKDKERLANSLKEALERNKVDIKEASIKQFLAYLKVSIKAQENLSFKGVIKGAKETLIVKAPGKKALTLTRKNIISDIFSIWLGNTKGNKALTRIKKEILKA